MSCTNPLLAYPPSDQRRQTDARYRILGHYNEIGDLFDISSIDENGVVIKPVLLPCGKCLSCKLSYAKEWSVRLFLEAQRYGGENCSFITLTYDDDHLPLVGSLPTLVPKHLTDFLKRLRRKFEPLQLRYFACGEYGSQTARPHYHLILFGTSFPDRYPYQSNFQNDIYYRSPILETLWFYGFSQVCDFSLQNAQYVARYTAKKLDNKFMSYIHDNDLVEPFVRMSRRPGLGNGMVDLCLDDKIYLPDGKISKYPRYFMKELKTVDPCTYQKISAKRNLALLDSDLYQYYSCGYSKAQIYGAQSRQVEKKTKSLSRDL